MLYWFSENVRQGYGYNPLPEKFQHNVTWVWYNNWVGSFDNCYINAVITTNLTYDIN